MGIVMKPVRYRPSEGIWVSFFQNEYNITNVLYTEITEIKNERYYNNNNNNNIHICIAPYGRNFRGANIIISR